MIKKVLKILILFIFTIGSLALIMIFEINNWPIGSSIGGLVAGFILSPLKNSLVDFLDNSNWKTSQTKLQRAKIINKNTIIRISFAYLFRIKVYGKYFLVKNARGTDKFQPVGGVYKFNDDESHYLCQNFFVENDNKIPVDESSKFDYRLRFKNQYLRKFVLRFYKEKNRENIQDLSREFEEELFDTEILDKENFGVLTYTYCGQHITELKYGEHFQCYELLLADIVNVKLTKDQEQIFRELMGKASDKYIFASDEEINSLGVKAGSNDLVEKIGNHTKKILISNNCKLTNPYKLWYKKRINKEYSINIGCNNYLCKT